MSNFIQYLLQSSASLAAFYLVYRFLLRQETFFKLNRVYLLISTLLSILLPLLKPDLYTLRSVQPLIYYLDPVIITPDRILQTASLQQFNWLEVAGIVYFTGLIIFGARFISRFIYMLILVKRNGLIRREGVNLVVMKKSCSPFSFLNFVFLDEDAVRSGDLHTILLHEKEHIRQFHSVDLILSEIVKMVQWFNPFAWRISRSLKSVHEFLADKGVLKSGIETDEYRQILVTRAIGKEVFAMSNNFNVSLIKTRIIMMTKSRSKNWAGLKVFFALPAVFTVLFFFSTGSLTLLSGQNQTGDKTTGKVQQKKSVAAADTLHRAKEQGENDKSLHKSSESKMGSNGAYKVVEKMPSFPGGESKLIHFLASNIKYPEDAKVKGMQGRVFIQFVVKKDGSITNVKIIRGFFLSCDEEAIRVVKLMPKWIPGEQKREKVDVEFALPIQFKLH
ncbi:MAG: M56 family metallopeptidase [Bacteroidetes bacterium]|nr:M56 family metallopeptidase [Bacteroidota bacterium]